MLEQITPLILTFNEEVNISRVLDNLRWAREVVVLDSGSTDRTRQICESFPNVRFDVRAFDNHAAQWNYGLKETGITSEWILALDADYVLEGKMIEELRGLVPDAETVGYRARFRYWLFGRPLSGSLYPPAVVLFRRALGRYVQDGHTQRLLIDGRVQDLKAEIQHDDRKPLSRWLAAQVRYAQLEAVLLHRKNWKELGWQDRLRKTVVMTPIIVPLYCLTVGKGILDGWRGMYYATQRAVAEAILSLAYLQHRYREGCAQKPEE